MTMTSKMLAKFSSYPVFTYRDVRLYMKGRKASDANLARMLSHMKRTKRIFSVVKGAYSTRVDERVSGFAFQPFYYGMLYALSIRELWTQNSRPEIITLRKVRHKSRPAFGGDVRITLHHSRPKYFFGFDMVKLGDMSVPVSDPEKTLIDLFFYKTRLPLQEYEGVLKAVSTRKLESYLKAYDGHTKAAVMNFVSRHSRLAKQGKLDSGY